MNQNIPPFYVGQKVKCIDNSGNVGRGLARGIEYTVTSVSYKCCGWRITVGLLLPSDKSGTYCGKCGKQRDYSGEQLFDASRFRAITDDFQAITFEKVVEEELVSMN